MSARWIDGKAIAAELRAELAQRARAFAAQHGAPPGLAVVLVGEDPASQVYVRNKDRAALEAGYAVRTLRLPAGIAQTELEAQVAELNADPRVHGILVQLPLPRGLDAGAVVRAIDPRKDVDGLHPMNVAALWSGEAVHSPGTPSGEAVHSPGTPSGVPVHLPGTPSGVPGLVPCTPLGCIELLERAQVPLEGARALVLGRSALVGKPIAALLLARNASVTIAHSRSRDLPELVGQAEVLIAAVGRAELVRGAWIRPGAAVIDVGINRTSDGRLVGDVETQAAAQRAGCITPVPGGVGPMTIAMLLANTLRAAERGSGAAQPPAREVAAPRVR